MASKRHRWLRRQRGRVLRAEMLEPRRMLDAAGWFGTLVHDAHGDLFAVDVADEMGVEYLGTMDTLMFDVAFAPDGKLYGVGGPVTGPSELFLINVDFGDPGGIIQTKSLGIVTHETSGQVFLNGLEFRDDGLLLGSGYDWAGNDYIYSISTENAHAEEEISLGTYTSAGDLVFAGDGKLYLTTFGGDLLQIEADLSGGQRVGSVGYSNFYGLSYGPGPVMYGFRETQGVYRINPADGSTTYLGLLSPPGLEGVLGAATVFEPPTDLGEVDFLDLPDESPILGELWYRIETAREGLFTADLPDAAAGADIGLTLYTQGEDSAINQVASGQLRLDHEATAGGEEYFLRVTEAGSGVRVRLTNLVVPDIDGATIYGTEGDDAFEFAAGATTTIAINGVGYEFDFSGQQTANVSFLGGEGSDSAVLTGAEGDEVAVLADGSATMSGPGYAVDVTEAASITADGGEGQDEATLNGSEHDEDADLSPAAAQLSRTGRLLRALNFETVTAHAGEGDDLAVFHDSSADDTLVAMPQYANLSAPGFSLTALGFDTIEAYGSADGNDIARFYDSAGDDSFVTVPSYGLLTGEGFSLQALSFNAVHAFAVFGGHDVARMYDSPGDDTFYATPVEAAFYGDGFFNRAKQFEEVHAYAAAGGHDLGLLLDGKGDDVFYASPVEGAMYGSGYFNRAKFFEELHGDASSGGTDIAKLFDSAGSDLLVAAPTYAALSGQGFNNRATNFDSVDAYGSGADGNYDIARLYDSPGDDAFVTTPTYGALIGDAYCNRVIGFDGVNAYAFAGGDDIAKMYDSPGDDTFYATPDEAMIWGPGYYHRAKGFGTVTAFGSGGGNDIARLFGSAGNDIFYASPVESAMYGDSFFNRTKYFDQVYGEAGAGGYDEAFLLDSPSIDLLEADANWARLSNAAADFLLQAASFARVKATASTPGDTKDVSPPGQLDFDLLLEGPWQDPAP